MCRRCMISTCLTFSPFKFRGQSNGSARIGSRAFLSAPECELSTTEIPTDTVADVLGVKTSTICRWRREGLSEASDQKSVGGRPRKLTDTQLVELASLLSKGAMAHGWPNELWTTKRMAELIRRHFNVNCHPNHAWTIVTKYLGWTAQRPIQQLRAADEDETDAGSRRTFLEYWKGRSGERLTSHSWMNRGLCLPRPYVGHTLRAASSRVQSC